MKEKCCSRWHEVKWKIAEKFLIFMTVTKRDIRHNWKMLCKTVSIIQQCHTCLSRSNVFLETGLYTFKLLCKLFFGPYSEVHRFKNDHILTMFHNYSELVCSILSRLNIFHICSSCCKMGRKHAKWHHNKNRPPKDLT